MPTESIYSHRIIDVITGVRASELRFTSKAEAERWLESYQVNQQYKDDHYRIVPDTAVIRAFPCSACKGAGSCSVCHTL